MTTDATAGHKTPKGRSPSYPGISLYTAIERARTLYAREGKHSAPMSAITRHWGYKSPTTGPASVTYAALKKYGLLEEEGNGAERMGKLTPLALDILLNSPEAPNAVQRAALMPPIHAEMWEEFGDNLPSDDNLRWRLVGQRGFTESGFKDFIRVYRETIAWAKLSSTQQVEVDEEIPGELDGGGETGEREDPANSRVDPGTNQRRGGMSGDTLTIPVPIIGGSPVIIEGKFPISEASWTQFMAVLAAMKPGLVSDPNTTTATPVADEDLL